MKTERLRTTVFDNAFQIVEKKGMPQLNVRKLAQVSSCSVGSIYNAFGSFQDLQLHINAKILEKLYKLLNQTLDQSLKEDKSLKEIFSDLGMAYVRFGQENQQLWKALFEYVSLEVLPEWYIKLTREGIFQICGRLSKIFGLPRSHAERIVGFFWAAIHGVCSILLNRKMQMVAELFSEESLSSYVEYCLHDLFKEVDEE